MSADTHLPRGLHLLADFHGVAAERLHDPLAIETLLREAARAAGATPVGGHFHPFGPGLGVTGVLFDRGACPTRAAFRLWFRQGKVRIAYATEQVDTPASAFGHVFLILGDDETPLPLWERVQFLAETSGANAFLGYAIRGLNGGFLGRYQRSAVFQTVFQYNHREQRDLYVADIPATQEQLEWLLLRLFEMRKVLLPYYFTSQNCSSRLADLLVAAGLYPKKRPKRFPSDVFGHYQSSLGAGLQRWPSLHTRITELQGGQTSSEREAFSEYLDFVFRPFIWLLNGFANLILKIFGIKPMSEMEIAF